MCGFSVENTINTLKTAFLKHFLELAAICFHIENLQHMTAVMHTHIPQKTFLYFSAVTQTTNVFNITVPRTVADCKIAQKGSFLFYLNVELIFYYQRFFFR